MRFWAIGLAFAALVLILPIGLRYGMSYNPDLLPDSYWIRFEFVFPLFVELSDGNVDISFPVSALGILFPVIGIAHIVLAVLGYRIAKREVDFSFVYKVILIITLLDLAAFFPTFLAEWGNIPLPLALLLGLPLAWLGKLPPVVDPFEDVESS